VDGCGVGDELGGGVEGDVVCGGVGAVCADAGADAGDGVWLLVLGCAGVRVGWWRLGAGEYGVAGDLGDGDAGAVVVVLDGVVDELADVVCVSVASL